MDNPRRVWIVAVVPTGIAQIIGGMHDRDHLLWTKSEAVREAAEMAVMLHLAPIQWSHVDEWLSIGRTHKRDDETREFAVLLRSALLPPVRHRW